jgi:dipeptidyl aminopeptidase/acylaminoacyl peptidase
MLRIVAAVLVSLLAILWVTSYMPSTKIDTSGTTSTREVKSEPAMEVSAPETPSQPAETTTASASGVERIERGNLRIEGIPEIPQSIVDRMTQYQNTRSAALQGWDAAGGGMVISTRFGETNQLHYVAEPLGVRRQLTFFDERVTGAAMNPNPNSREFLFTKDIGGSEFYQIFSFDLDTGETQLLTDGDSRHGFVNWSNTGKYYSYYSTLRNGADWDLYVAEIDDPSSSRMVHESAGIWVALEWSPNDEELLVLNYVSINESSVHVLDIESGELRPVNPSDETISFGNAAWDPDGDGVYITSDQGGEFQQLRYYDLVESEQTDLTPNLTWDIDEMAVAPNGGSLAYITNEGGLSGLYLMDTATYVSEAVPNVPVGQVYGLSYHPSGDKIALVINTPQTPGDIYVLNLDDLKFTRWTQSEVGGLNTDNFVIPELIHYPTFDEVDGAPRQIPAFVYEPHGEGPHPVLIYIHGGPESQFQPSFISSFQYYALELGVAVIAPNVRGSAGYGKNYLKLDNGFNREDSVKDIGALLDWIDEQPNLDSDRVAVRGGSYGGYMVLASMVNYNDRLRAGIDNVGISNFVTFLQNTEDYRRDARRAEYGDEQDPDMYEYLQSISPSNHADKITKPMLIVQGYNDPRVPVTEAEQMVAAIRQNSGEVWYLLAMDEGHGFSKKSNRDFYSHSMVLFLQEFLVK